MTKTKITDYKLRRLSVHQIVCDLQRLVGFDAGAADHERDPDVELIQLPLVDGQRELTWNREDDR